MWLYPRCTAKFGSRVILGLALETVPEAQLGEAQDWIPFERGLCAAPNGFKT